ncbi:GNAT family N-acetyltransferase [Marinomonas mediterranea]|uniref:GNAT family N-acetyltransferase n=1 Tax=Marinomonas mediterranea TaxID=119864 RepID=UPI003AF061C6
MFNPNDYFIYIVVENNDPIGFIEFSIRKDAPRSHDQEIPYIEGWCIRSKYRGKEYGRNLMEFVEGWAIQKGYRKLASDTTTHYPGSLKANKTVGFTKIKTTHHFIKEI